MFKLKNPFTSDNGGANPRTAASGERDHQRERPQHGDESGYRLLFPGAKPDQERAMPPLAKVIMPDEVFDGIVREYQPLLTIARQSPGRVESSTAGGGVLIGDLDELRDHGRLKIVDCISARGGVSHSWRNEGHGLRAELDWYGRSVRHVFFAGEWQLLPFEDLDRPSRDAAAGFARLVSYSELLSVPAALLLHVCLHQLRPTAKDPADVWEGRWQVHYRAFLWHGGDDRYRDVHVQFERDGAQRVRAAQRPWHIQDRSRFDFELKMLSTFAGDVKASFLADMRAVFCITDPAWLDELILVAPNGYPREEPVVMLRPRGGDDCRTVDLADIGFRWTEDSLLVRVLYALERCSEPDAGDIKPVDHWRTGA